MQDLKIKPNKTEKNPFAVMEEEVQKFWEDNKIFEKSVEKDAPMGDYVFYDGPPFATGMPHYGHLVASIMKDAVPRYWTMRGFRVKRKWGWDCHGLPVENLAEKELGLNDKTDIEKIGVKQFNEYCESIVLRFANDWKNIIKRIGRWVDMENDYKTMDPEFMESVWWVFKSLWEKGLIYQGYKAMHICPRCGTTLSNFEVGQGYKDVKDLSAVVKFKIKNEELKINDFDVKGDIYFLAWTTTPWTLIGNVALAVNRDIGYLILDIGKDEKIIIAKDRKNEILKDADCMILMEVNGEDLIGIEYEPLFDYYSSDQNLKNRENGWKVYAGDFVTTEEGTGIVHIAPAFGEDDMNMGKQFNLPFVQHVDQNGRFKAEVTDWPGREVKPKDDAMSTDVEIIKYLAHKGVLFLKEKYEHSYPHCWRCETPLLNYATDSWFVEVTKLTEKLVSNNKNVSWVPDHVKEGRFGKWLEQARDWAISRNRYWGACLPVWKCQTCGETDVVGSIAELEAKCGQKVPDLHKQHVDLLHWDCGKCGGRMQRIPEVLDCWFESGSMPYAQMNYLGKPLPDFDPEKKHNFPAQFIAEGIDQTRGWFYTLMVLSTALFDREPYQNVIVNGIVLAEDGQKMSKSKQNYPDPSLIFDKYGVDAIRYYLLSSPVLLAENLNFSENGVKDVLRKTVMLLWNVCKFYEMFAQDSEAGNADKFDSANVLDKWIVARLEETASEIGSGIDSYNFPKAARPILKFIDDLSTWYLRRSRDRFKGDLKRGATKAAHANGSKELNDKQQAIATTKFVLINFSKIIAPLMPFIAERVWQMASGFDFKDSDRSVHLEAWPSFAKATDGKADDEDAKIIADMEKTRKIVEMALFKRDLAGIKVRQPLQKLQVTSYKLQDEYADLIKDEINVKEVEFTEGEVLDVELDLNITPELKQEGLKREFVRQANALRKEKGLSINDKAVLYWEANSREIADMLRVYGKEIADDCLLQKLIQGLPSGFEGYSECNIDGELVVMGLLIKN